MGELGYWWSCTGKGLRLQPAQQACFYRTGVNILLWTWIIFIFNNIKKNGQLSWPMLLSLISLKPKKCTLPLGSSGKSVVNRTNYLKVGKGYQYRVCTCNIWFCSQISFTWKKGLQVWDPFPPHKNPKYFKKLPWYQQRKTTWNTPLPHPKPLVS